MIKIINENRKNEIIPSPKIEYYLLRNKNFLNIIKNKNGLCLICNKKFQTPTAIKCCGGVFCYKCINKYLYIFNYKIFFFYSKWINVVNDIKINYFKLNINHGDW